MHKYFAKITWQCDNTTFIEGKYSRVHEWEFDGGVVVSASSSPLIVPLPYSSAAAIDPEEAFVASLSSCHMLWFLSIAAKMGYSVESYEDRAVGEMGINSVGKMAMLTVTLQPHVKFLGVNIPTKEQLINMHGVAHEECFIASSVKSEVICVPVV